MKKRGNLAFYGLIIGIMLLIPMASASFSLKNYSVQKNYAGGETVKGNLDISFTNEPARGLVTSNFNGNITLLDLLKNNSLQEGRDFNCNIIGCGASYSAKESISALSLTSGAKKVIGLKASGNNVEIKKAKISISSNALPSCQSQAVIDIGELGNAMVQNTRYKANICGFNSGCFNSGLQESGYDMAKITSIPYCENLTLEASPAYYAGARVKNSTSGQSNLKMKLYDSSWDELGECTLPKNKQETENLKCIINYSNIKSQGYFLCIETDSGSQSNYMIKSEQSGQICGTTDAGSNTLNRDYDIFAESLQFDSLQIEVNESTFSKFNEIGLSQYLDDYIQNNYGRNCSAGCVIPIAINAGSDQSINFASIEIEYLSDGAVLTSNQAYSLEKKNSDLSSPGLSINLEKAGFEIPVETSENRLMISLNGNSLLTASINVTPGFYFDIKPKNIFVGIDTTFQIISGSNISSSLWKFGDGSPSIQGNGKTIAHKYNEEGNYTLEVEATDNRGVKGIKKIQISAGNANASAGILIKRYEARVQNLSAQIKNYSPWLLERIKEKENLSYINSSLIAIKKEYLEAKNDSQYAEIVQKLGEMKVPYAISSSESGKAPLAIGFDNIDTSYIEELSNKSLTDKSRENLKLLIINWNEENYDSEIEYQIISSYYDLGKEDLLTYAKIKLHAKGNPEPGFLIINYPKEEIKFMQNYGEIEVSRGSSATAIPISGDKELELILSEGVDVSELGSYVSPNLDKFQSLEGRPFIEKNTRPGTAIWLYVLLIIGFFAVYITLQEWYKRHYESFLFKNKDDLYNIINFMHNARISQLGDNEIRGKLSGLKWKGEQISYAFKKLDGKRTGMWEIPVFRYWERNKIKREIAKRQGNQGDARFIKRPTL